MLKTIGKKVARLQDSYFKLNRNGSNESSIFLSNSLATELDLKDGENRIFLINHENLLKALCFIYSFPKPLFKKDDFAVRDLNWFQKQVDSLNKHFNDSIEAEYKVEVILQSGNRQYLKSLKQESSINIRDLLIERHSIIYFESDNSNKFWLKICNSLEELSLEEEQAITPLLPKITPLQKIYFGSPGTGKSTALQAFAKTNDLEVIRTTFHPDTDYQSFVGAYKPIMMKDAKISYQFIPQVFTKAYVKAYQNPDKAYILAIEEINRGNCAQIFGDIFQSLDRAKNGFSTYEVEAEAELAQYLVSQGLESTIKLPPNLLIHATMNTSDQSLFPMDAAFKRRWEWEYVPIIFDEASAKINIVFDEETNYNWKEFVEAVNTRIQEITESEDKKIGVYFITPNDENATIDLEQFKNKVMFYLWSEIYKDEHKNEESIFKFINSEGNSEDFTFNELFDNQGLEKLKGFMKLLLVQ